MKEGREGQCQIKGKAKADHLKRMIKRMIKRVIAKKSKWNLNKIKFVSDELYFIFRNYF
jgi:hypothetical protein